MKSLRDLKTATILSAFAIVLFLGLIIYAYTAYPSGKLISILMFFGFIVIFIKNYCAYNKCKKELVDDNTETVDETVHND